jgi:DNA gyrase subunit A
MGRATMGVRGIKLGKDDLVIGVEMLKEAGTILTVTEKGFGKRTEVVNYRSQNRGGMGLIDIKTSPRNGPVIGQKLVDGGDEVMIITSKGKLIRTGTQGIKVQGRNTQGVKIIDLGAGDKVVAVARLADSS